MRQKVVADERAQQDEIVDDAGNNSAATIKWRRRGLRGLAAWEPAYPQCKHKHRPLQIESEWEAGRQRGKLEGEVTPDQVDPHNLQVSGVDTR